MQPEPISKNKLMRIKITGTHTHQMPIQHGRHNDWLTQLATESHCTLDWQDELVRASGVLIAFDLRITLKRKNI